MSVYPSRQLKHHLLTFPRIPHLTQLQVPAQVNYPVLPWCPFHKCNYSHYDLVLQSIMHLPLSSTRPRFTVRPCVFYLHCIPAASTISPEFSWMNENILNNPWGGEYRFEHVGCQWRRKLRWRDFTPGHKIELALKPKSSDSMIVKYSAKCPFHQFKS